jgi:predicted short-subunit dehydrogenase-like oxidoreductase (DUF2520 family)
MGALHSLEWTLSTQPTTEDFAARATPALGGIVVVGGGRVGTALSCEMARAGLPLIGLWNRSQAQRPDGLGDAAFEAGSPRPPSVWLERATLVLLAVRDDVIDAVAAKLPLRPGMTVMHCSGALGSDILRSVAPGVSRGSYHPLQSFASQPARTLAVPPYVVAIEGDDEALARAEQLAAATGHRSLCLAADQKAGYHAAAVLASNCLVALEAAASRVMGASIDDDERAWQLLWPLVVGTLSGLEDGRFAAAITGPVARGDANGVRRNLDALEGDRGARDLYRSLGREALRIAADAGLEARQLERIRAALHED